MMRSMLATMVLVAGLGMFGPSSALAADWTIRIDNYGNPDAPGNWSTTDHVGLAIEYHDGGGSYIVLGYSVPFANQIGNHDIAISNSYIPLSGVDSIEVFIDGDNMFVIDQIEVFDTSGNLYNVQGADNMVGWCISEDDDDYFNNPVCLNGTGARSHKFHL